MNKCKVRHADKNTIESVELLDFLSLQVIVKGERRRGRKGEIALDDMSLKRGSCQEEHNLRRL